MNKLKRLILFAILSVNALAIEGNIKAGFDFYRSTSYKRLDNNSADVVPYDKGFVIGAEILPLTFVDNKIKLGVGAEYNFGIKTVQYERSHDYYPYSVTMIPVYGTAKFTYYRTKNTDLNLYAFGRIGYAFARETLKNYPNFSYNTGGVYYGAGLGLDYKYFLVEVLYDGKFNHLKIERDVYYNHSPQPTTLKIKKTNTTEKYNNFHHKVGIRVGLQLGSQHFTKPQVICKECQDKIIEKIVEVPKIIEVTKLVEKIVKVPVENKIKKKKTRKVKQNKMQNTKKKCKCTYKK